MHLLSDYQRAALEVMGIPVWVSQSEMQSALSEKSVSDTVSVESTTASPEDRAAKLAALRAQVSSDKASSPTTDRPATAEKVSPTPVTRPLSAEEMKAAGKLLNDIQLAASSVNFSEHTLAFEVGDQLKVTPGRITFPRVPSELTVSDKRALWKALNKR